MRSIECKHCQIKLPFEIRNFSILKKRYDIDGERIGSLCDSCYEKLRKERLFETYKNFEIYTKNNMFFAGWTYEVIPFDSLESCKSTLKRGDKTMTRNELRNKYPEEEIYVVPSSVLNLINIDFDIITDAIKEHGIFQLRSEMEYNPCFKQVIPYCIIANKNINKIFMTKRIQGDTRLIGKSSIGQGGHINPVDDSNGDIIFDCMLRELKEELDINKSDIVSFNVKGVIYDPTNDVGLDHLGLVFYIEINKENITVKETESLEGSWATQQELVDNRANLESWSQLAIDLI